jgi:alanyl-tRNA synthetase
MRAALKNIVARKGTPIVATTVDTAERLGNTFAHENIVLDHFRAMVNLITDGVLPR